MTQDADQRGKSPAPQQRPGSANKNAAALAAALRANLARRKARQRALRAKERQGEAEPAQQDEAKWTK
ncbi:MAG: hypothetical protein HYS06_13210 [Methylocystis sp.]|nr:hypothetical protein [Methylocystis sp.]MBI3274756.1 hypothetical protein [Methylocystis sp.]